MLKVKYESYEKQKYTLKDGTEKEKKDDVGDARKGDDNDGFVYDRAAYSQAPKRPLSPFIFYSQDARRIIKKENPSLHSK